MEVALPTEVIGPVKLALVVTLPAVRPAAVPVMLVPTRAEGVPRAGVTKVGLLAKTKAPLPVSSVIAVERAKEVVGEQPVQEVTVRTLKVGEEVVARVWFTPSRKAHSVVFKVLAPMVKEVAVRAARVVAPPTFKVPVKVEFPVTSRVVIFPVSAINLLADKSVTEKMEAPPKLVEGLEGM